MNQTGAIWLVILAALVAANLPFINHRLLAVVPLQGPKSLPIRALELLFFYAVAGGIGLVLERQAGQISPQGWEFYAVTGALFLTLAFPGFVYRYLLKHRGAGKSPV